MKILCVSVHPVLEYDEVRMLERLGHDVFCLGFYFDRQQDNGIRPLMPENDWHRDCKAAFVRLGCERNSGATPWHVTAAFCDLFDLILVHHNYNFIKENWDSVRSKRVIWRTIGQELHWAENAMREYRNAGVKIVRWSPVERAIDGYIGEDAVIRACKDPAEWTGWLGTDETVVTFSNTFQQRRDALSYDFYAEAVLGVNAELYGLSNDGIVQWKGMASYPDQQKLLQQSRVAFVTGTWPAPYTLGFIEAWMTGTPTVHIGPPIFTKDNQAMLEVDSLIQNGETGFIVNSVEEAHKAFIGLLSNPALAADISAAGRQAAISVFGIDKAMEDWSHFLETV